MKLGNAQGEDGQHALTMEFGEAELVENEDELEAGEMLDPIRQQRNARLYRQASDELGLTPKVARTVVDAAARRIETVPDTAD